LDWPKSPAAISADISFVAAGKRRDFCPLRLAKHPRRFRRTSASLPRAKGETFARYASPSIRGDFGGHQLRSRGQKA